MNKKVYEQLVDRTNKHQKTYCLLIDPDKTTEKDCWHLIEKCQTVSPDVFLVGGSLITVGNLAKTVDILKQNTHHAPVVLFTGSYFHLVAHADALLLLSLISGRNPEYLIGQQVAAAPIIKQMALEAIATGYLLVDCGNKTTAAYMSHTAPIPYEKPDIAACTALAGEMLGLKLIYLDGGSGAAKPISVEMIAATKAQINVPLIVGGGIRTPKDMENAYHAGADMVVTGTAVEQNPELLHAFCQITKSINAA